VPFLLTGLLLAFLVMLLFGGSDFDRALLMLLHVRDDPRLAAAAGPVALLVSPFALAVMGAAGAGTRLVRRDWRSALLLLSITAGVVLLGEYLASLSAPVRPPLPERADPGSRFPSLSAAGTAAVWPALAFLLTQHRPWRAVAVAFAVLFALAAGIFQLLTGAAWPSDVIGGWALGLFWALLLLWLAGTDLGDGTPRPVRHSPPEGEHHGQSPHRDGPRDGRQGPD
jgi:membrane-associated phospholipid phosphatase